MGFLRNTISDEEHKERTMKLLNQGNINSREELSELYVLYNDRMTPRKSDKSCGACRAYVWNRLKQYYGII